MNKPNPSNATLQELWTIKDETAARFKSTADYFEYLQSQIDSSPSKAKSVAKRIPQARRPRVLQAH
jgi:FAD/FMN-containing dehydrogenase